MSWTGQFAPFADLDSELQNELRALKEQHIPSQQTLFRPQDEPQGFVVVVSGRVDVFLTGPTGREIVLYSVSPGETCIQTTIGLVSEQLYTGEAITSAPSEIVLIPKALFNELMDRSKAFRSFVFSGFGTRVQDMMGVLERIAFQKVESRLALKLLERADGGSVTITQAELAAQIGSAREVVARQLDAFAKRGLIERERGRIRLLNLAKLRSIAEILNAV